MYGMILLIDARLIGFYSVAKRKKITQLNSLEVERTQK
jgi:hypothetical protein